MIEAKDITKMVHHILRRDQGIADTHIMHPTRDWFIGLGVTGFMVVVGSWFCFYLYLYHTGEMQKEAVIIEQAIPYQAGIVKSALEIYSLKEKKYTEILGLANNSSQSEALSTTAPVKVTETVGTNIPGLIIDPLPIFTDDGAVLVP